MRQRDSHDGLAGQVVPVGRISEAQIERLRHEALTAPRSWRTEYGDYQSGGWHTTSLMNASGDADDVVIGDCVAMPTELLARMPATASLLAELGLRYMWVRLARLEASAFLWEHRDYGELDRVERCRLHIPLHTNPSALLVTGGAKTHLAAGWIWRLTPTCAHGACNLLGPDRIHLIADVYVNDAYRRLAAPAIAPPTATPLPAPSQAVLAEKVADARRLADLGYGQAAERLLLRLYYHYALPEGVAYDLVAEMYEASGDAEASARWRATKTHLLALDE